MLNEREHPADLGVDGRRTLKLILNTTGRSGLGLVCLKIRPPTYTTYINPGSIVTPWKFRSVCLLKALRKGHKYLGPEAEPLTRDYAYCIRILYWTRSETFQSKLLLLRCYI